MRRILGTVLQIQVRAWAVIAFVVVIVAAVSVGVTLYGHQNHHFAETLNAEQNARIDSGRLQREQNDYTLCERIDGVLGVTRAVVDTAFTGTVTITAQQVAKLPATTRRLLEELAPALQDSSRATTVTKAHVLDQIPDAADCGRPPPGVVPTTAPTTTRPSG